MWAGDGRKWSGNAVVSARQHRAPDETYLRRLNQAMVARGFLTTSAGSLEWSGIPNRHDPVRWESWEIRVALRARDDARKVSASAGFAAA